MLRKISVLFHFKSLVKTDYLYFLKYSFYILMLRKFKLYFILNDKLSQIICLDGALVIVCFLYGRIISDKLTNK